MRFSAAFLSLFSSLMLVACFHRGPNPIDPYEGWNRKVYRFNQAVDATFLRPPAKAYRAILPRFVRRGVTNVYANLDMIPTVANDILQADFPHTIKDSWRFFVNSTFGIAGLLDVASTFSLPPHSNDLGLTFAKWGDKHSPYVVIPLVGPSTIRDGAGMLFQYPLISPYSFISGTYLVYSLMSVHYLDIRARYLDAEKLMRDAIDPYAFMRDAFLQNRNYQINGSVEQKPADYVDA